MLFTVEVYVAVLFKFVVLCVIGANYKPSSPGRASPAPRVHRTFSSSTIQGQRNPTKRPSQAPRSTPAHGVTTTECPRVCFCNSPSRIVYCSRRGLSAIPDGISPDTLQLNLNGNAFDSPLIGRLNLSRYLQLEHLYLSECALETIEVGAFSDLTDLRWLDLSNNRIKSIEPDTFHGVTLQHLFLNGNINIQIVTESFSGLATTGLYLHDCSLGNIDPDAIGQLNFTLRYLWLNGNELERIEPALRPLFSVLLHLRLGSNPFRCSCWAVWLKRFYDQSPETFKGAVPPTCLTPSALKGRQFNQLSLRDLRCQTPMFSHVEATFDTDSSVGRLSCSASGDPTPVLYWIQPSGRAARFSAPPPSEDMEDEPGLNEAVLELEAGGDNDVTQSGMYICVADNEAGNATLTVSLPSPVKRIRKSSTTTTTTTTMFTTRPINQLMTPVHIIRPTHNNNNNSSNNNNNNNNRTSLNQLLQDVISNVDKSFIVNSVDNSELSVSREHDSDRLFTVTELTWAVVTTHVITLVICVCLAAVVCYRTRVSGTDDTKDVDKLEDDEFERRHIHSLRVTSRDQRVRNDTRHSRVIHRIQDCSDMHSLRSLSAMNSSANNDLEHKFNVLSDLSPETSVYLRLSGLQQQYQRCSRLGYMSDTSTTAVSLTR